MQQCLRRGLDKVGSAPDSDKPSSVSRGFWRRLFLDTVGDGQQRPGERRTIQKGHSDDFKHIHYWTNTYLTQVAS
jgi:hypothetical protein